MSIESGWFHQPLSPGNSVTHGYGSKWGEFDPDKIIDEMYWSKDDVIIAQGDYGTIHELTEEAKLYHLTEEFE